MNILEDLEFRGLIYQTTDREGLEKKLSEGPSALYCGFDPTADSLHIGNLLPILILRRFQLAGHIPLALVGGGTGMIGDPSGRSAERSLNELETVEAWSAKIKSQLSRFLDFDAKDNAARIVNNYDWLSQLSLIEFLRDTGKHYTVNYMLAKDSVASRLENGISFTEFTYMILQSYDFMQLNKDHDCILQIGGSDQWGNITAGTELIGRTLNNRAYGLTMPLVTKSDGSKFGKTAGGAIWLDAAKTSPYQFYQFWYNTDDQDVIPFIKYFTFLSKDEIEALQKGVAEAPEKREAQRVLAMEVTSLVHGEASLNSAIAISRALFDGQVKELSVQEIEEAFQDVPSIALKQDEIGLVDLIVESGASPSKRQAREDIGNGAVLLNGDRMSDANRTITKEDGLHGRYIVIRRGKKNYFVAKFE